MSANSVGVYRFFLVFKDEATSFRYVQKSYLKYAYLKKCIT